MALANFAAFSTLYSNAVCEMKILMIFFCFFNNFPDTQRQYIARHCNDRRFFWGKIDLEVGILVKMYCKDVFSRYNTRFKRIGIRL